jgi:hypothetical protein
MKLTHLNVQSHNRQGGWALLVVMTLAACALMLLASVISWANANSTTTARNNEFFATSYAAEAATEKVLASLSQQYQNYGFTVVNQNMSTYASTLPTASDSPYWSSYQFSGGTTANHVIVTNTASLAQIVMGAPYTGLTMMAQTFEIIANAQNTTSQYQLVSTVGQQIYLGNIPLFQFAIFYQGDMEISPGAAMTVSGPVHGNANIYLDPADGLTLSNNISAVKTIYTNSSPENPVPNTFSFVNFDGLQLDNVEPLNMPVGTNTTGLVSNSSQNVYAILGVPQAGQTPSSSTGSNLLYNQADMIILISNNNTISVTSGAGVNNQATVLSNNQWSSWLSTNGSFYDQRDSLTVNPVVINVSNLVTWSASSTNPLYSVLSSLRGASDANVQSIYVADLRSTSNAAVTTNYTTGTQVTTTSSGPPAAGSYAPPITSTNLTTTNSTGTTPPNSGTYVGALTTNFASTTSTYAQGVPSPGTYTGAITTNTTVTTSSTKPTSDYLGSITTNGSGSNKTYTYNKITGYTYDGISGYTYNIVSGYTYNAYVTNASYLTNWTINSQPGVVLSNGAALPPQGLSIATPDPAYIIGNWNVNLTPSGTSDASSSSTAYSLPSAIYSDAVTILSSAWNPANSTLGISSRNATTDTVNAAFLTGNVPSNGDYYSGGVENFPRFLENWGGQTFYYNGSLVQMFTSQIANAPWPGTGTVYNPPTRIWSFDNNLSNPAKQPPLTPKVISVQRAQWTLLKPYTTSF